MKNRSANILAGAMILIALGLAISSVWDDAPIVDEIPHIGAGYSYIAKLDARLNPEHPPLAKDLAGLSLKLNKINDEPAFQSRFWQEDLNGQWEFGRKLIFDSGNDANYVSHLAKLPLLTFFILSAIIVFIWTQKLAGQKAGLIAVFLFAFSPTLIAHSRFVTTDVPALFGVLFSSYFFLQYLKKPDKKSLAAAGIAFGISELTKFSLFLLVPFFILMAGFYAFLNFPHRKFYHMGVYIGATICIIAIGYIFVVWPVYIIHTWNYPTELQQSQTKILLESYGRRPIADTVTYLSGKPLVRGLAEYGLGLLMVTQRSVGGNTTYFMGEVRNWAWPQYFPIVYFIKEPLPFWGLLALASLYLAGTFRTFRPKRILRHAIEWSRDNYEKFFMLVWLALYWFVSIRANLNIGVRHLMPIYGFTFILLSACLVKIGSGINSRKMAMSYWLVIAGLLGWYLGENLSVYPYYLTYFNQTTGGPSGGYRYVVDSNLDWGQDLKRLADWVHKNNIKKIYLDYFGWSNQDYYIREGLVWLSAGKYTSTKEFLAENPEGGYVAVSASFYMGSIEHPETSYLSWLDPDKTITKIGNSIFIWYIPPLAK